jgi:hypothetical protein
LSRRNCRSDARPASDHDRRISRRHVPFPKWSDRISQIYSVKTLRIAAHDERDRINRNAPSCSD